jgi:hypothetical protein
MQCAVCVLVLMLFAVCLGVNNLRSLCLGVDAVPNLYLGVNTVRSVQGEPQRRQSVGCSWTVCVMTSLGLFITSLHVEIVFSV